MGCRREAPKRELLRVALSGQAGARQVAAIDRDGRLAGRGAYLCRSAEGGGPRVECLQAAVRRGAFARALRASVTLDRKLVESVGR